MKAALAASFTLALLSAPLAFGQSAPGQPADLAILSADLQTSRNSAAAIHAQAEQIRLQKVLAAREREAVAPNPDAATPPEEEAGEFTVVIPTGKGLVPARSNRPAPAIEMGPVHGTDRE
jgi:hypothetical protein